MGPHGRFTSFTHQDTHCYREHAGEPLGDQRLQNPSNRLAAVRVPKPYRNFSHRCCRHPYYWAARGADERPVRADRTRNSVGAENTFPVDLFTYEAARDALREIVDKVWRYCEGAGIRGRTVTLKVKFANFQIITRSRTGQMQIRTRGELEQLGDALLEPLFPVARGIRLLGISMSSLAAEQAEQPEFSLPV